MRKLSAKWHRKSFGKISFTMTLIRNVAPTHAIVCFHADGSTSVVPTKQLTTTPPDRSPKPGDICDVLWNDKNTYTATVRAIGSDYWFTHSLVYVCGALGSQKEMESMMDVGSSSDENGKVKHNIISLVKDVFSTSVTWMMKMMILMMKMVMKRKYYLVYVALKLPLKLININSAL